MSFPSSQNPHGSNPEIICLELVFHPASPKLQQGRATCLLGTAFSPGPSAGQDTPPPARRPPFPKDPALLRPLRPASLSPRQLPMVKGLPAPGTGIPQQPYQAATASLVIYSGENRSREGNGWPWGTRASRQPDCNHSQQPSSIPDLQGPSTPCLGWTPRAEESYESASHSHKLMSCPQLSKGQRFSKACVCRALDQGSGVMGAAPWWQKFGEHWLGKRSCRFIACRTSQSFPGEMRTEFPKHLQPWG